MESGLQLIKHYFPHLTHHQVELVEMLAPLYKEWNSKINVISRKDIDHLYLHHVLHSLSIAKIIQFKPGTKILDVGTGGGFPGIPLAIYFPEVQFHLVDSIGKKITVVQEISKALELKNVTATKSRAEELTEKVDFIVSRAVTTLSEMVGWTHHLIRKQSNHSLANGILYLKGGELDAEIKELDTQVRVFEIKEFFEEEFFETKKVVYIPC